MVWPEVVLLIVLSVGLTWAASSTTTTNTATTTTNTGAVSTSTTTKEPLSDYVVPDSVSCNAAGVTFDLSHNSFLYQDIGVFAVLVNNTACEEKVLFISQAPGRPPTTNVTLFREQCNYTLTTVYGAGERPVAYGVMLYFYAQRAKFDPSCKDYTCIDKNAEKHYFEIYCLYPAVAHIHTNHSIDNGGPNVNPHGKIPKPSDHVLMNFTDDHNNNLNGKTVYAGNRVRALISMREADDTYDSIMPWYCYFSATLDNQVGFKIPFIIGGCPDPDNVNWEVIKDVKKANNTAYYVDFDAFTMNGEYSGNLFVICDIYLCVKYSFCTPPAPNEKCWDESKKRKRSISQMTRIKRDVPDQSANPDSYGNFYAEGHQKLYVQYHTGPTTKGPDNPTDKTPTSTGSVPNWLVYLLIVFGALLFVGLFICCVCCFVCGITLFGVGFGRSRKERREPETAYTYPEDNSTLHIPHAWLSNSSKGY